MKTNCKKIFLSIICFVVFCATHAQDSLSFSIASNSFAKGNAKDAIYWFSKSIEKKYLLADSYMYRGASKASLGDFEEAFKDLFYSYKLDSSTYLTCEFIGNIYIAINKADSGILWLGKAIARYPNDADAYNNRAAVYKSLKEYDQAMKDVEKALAIEPNTRTYLLNRGSIKQDQLNYAEALDDYKTALSLDPILEKNIMTYLNMAICHAGLNEIDEALAAVNKILDRYPNTGEALEARGQLYNAVGRKDEACADFEKLNVLDSTVAKDYLDKFCR